MTSSDEERETLIADYREYIDKMVPRVRPRPGDEEMPDPIALLHRMAAALQRPVWEVQAEALEAAIERLRSEDIAPWHVIEWLEGDAAELRRSETTGSES